MVCPNCYAELKEGHLYCENCGAEIQIVPDFEPEIEDRMHMTLSGVAEELSDSKPIETSPNQDALKKRDKNPGKKELLFFLAGLIVVCIAIAAGVGISRYYSYEYQYEKAMQEYGNGSYELSVGTARHAISLNQEEEKTKLLLADGYYALGKYDEAIAVLMGMLDSFPGDVDIYERLVSNYEIKGDNLAIGALIKDSGDTAIMAKFSDYVSVPPEFSLEEGTYYKQETLRLTANGNGTVYYTLDGSAPDENAHKYQTPLSLVGGTIVVSAVYVNEKGIVSEPVRKTYTVELKVPEMPKLLTKGGKYDAPVLIRLEEPEEGIIYYTTDGTEPTADSEIYSLPIPMPLGTSQFKFVSISREGLSSEVVAAGYNLQIATIVDKAAAEAAIRFFLQAKGDTAAGNEYLCTSAYGAGSRNYYLVDEYQVKDGKKERTDRIFAVDVRTGELYKANINIIKGEYEFSFLY